MSNYRLECVDCGKQSRPPASSNPPQTSYYMDMKRFGWSFKPVRCPACNEKLIPAPSTAVCSHCAKSVRETAAYAVQERALAVEGRIAAAERDDVDYATIEWLRATARELRRVEDELRIVMRVMD